MAGTGSEPSGAPGRWAALVGVARATGRRLRGHDLALYAAGVTFYAGIALVPSLLVAIRVATLIVGEESILELAGSLAEALPGALGAPRVALQLIDTGTELTLLTGLIAVLPATLYGEGLRRAFVSLSGAGDRLTGWRGRLGVLPLFAVAPLLLLAVLLVTPLLAQLYGEGAAPTALGVYVALTVDWLVLSVALAYVYRVVGPRSPRWPALAWGAAITGSIVAGFVQGFVLFLAIPVDLGAPFGGYVAVGGAVAVGFWLWLLHGLTLVGYVYTLALDERGGVPWRDARPDVPDAAAPGAAPPAPGVPGAAVPDAPDPETPVVERG